MRKAADAFLGQLKTGEIDMFRTLDWIGKEDIDALEKFQKSDDVLEAIRTGGSPDDIKSKLDEIWETMRQDAKNVANDMPAVAEDAVGGADALLPGADLSDEARELAHNHIQANHRAILDTDEAVKMSVRGMPEYDDLYRQTSRASADLADQSKAFGDKWNRWKDKLDADITHHNPVNLTNKWQELGLTTPTPLDWGEFKRRFWNEFYFPKQNEFHVQRRDLWEEALKAVKGRLGTNPTIDAAERVINTAKNWDERAEIVRGTKFALEDAIAAKRPKQVTLILAERYGVPTRAISGADLDKRVLDTVNKYLPEDAPKFTSLDDITMDDIPAIEDALARRVAGAAPPKALEFREKNATLILLMM